MCKKFRLKRHYRKQIEKSSCWGKTSMTLGGLLPRGKAEGQEGVKGSLDEALDCERATPPWQGCSTVALAAENRTDVTKASSKHQQTPLGHCRERCTWTSSGTLRQRPFSSRPRDTSAANRSPCPGCQVPRKLSALPANTSCPGTSRPRPAGKPRQRPPHSDHPRAPHALPAAGVSEGPVKAVPALGLAWRGIRYELYWEGMGRKCQ